MLLALRTAQSDLLREVKRTLDKGEPELEAGARGAIWAIGRTLETIENLEAALSRCDCRDCAGKEPVLHIQKRRTA